MPRIGDIYAALPAITGKLELEYEGEMKGADNVGRELIRAAIAKHLRRLLQRQRTCSRSCNGSTWAARSSWRFSGAQRELMQALRRHPGPDGQARANSGVEPERQSAEEQVSAAEFILEGLHAHKRIGRNEERVFSAGEKQPKREKHGEARLGPTKSRLSQERN